MDEELGQVLQTLHAQLQRLLGEELAGVLLFGSRARGDARPDSDVDVLVIVRHDFDYGELLARTSALVSALSLEHDLVISRSFVTQAQYEHEQSPFMLNVRREAVAI